MKPHRFIDGDEALGLLPGTKIICVRRYGAPIPVGEEAFVLDVIRSARGGATL